MSDVWYFAYGSNLDRKKFEKRAGKYLESRKAVLRDYRICFNTFHPGWNCGVADIVESKGDDVYGVVYRIKEEQLSRLDKAVGVPQFYRRMIVEVETEKGVVTAYTYTTVKKRGFVAPSEAYLGHILKGLKQHGWGEEALETIRRAARR